MNSKIDFTIGQEVYILHPNAEHFLSYIGMHEQYLKFVKQTEGDIDNIVCKTKIIGLNLGGNTRETILYIVDYFNSIKQNLIYATKEECIEKNSYWVNKILTDHSNYSKLAREFNVNRVKQLAASLNVKIEVIDEDTTDLGD